MQITKVKKFLVALLKGCLSLGSVVVCSAHPLFRQPQHLNPDLYWYIWHVPPFSARRWPEKRATRTPL